MKAVENIVGNISLYDSEGKRHHTIYFGAAPESGKATFKQRYEIEIQRIKAQYPEVLYLGITDGAKDNWTFLAPHVDKQLLDFYHVSEYLAAASHAVYPKKKNQVARKQWLLDVCSQLKHESQAANLICTELTEIKASCLPKKIQEGLEATLTYFKSNKVDRMDYAYHTRKNLPIGSGVTKLPVKHS